MCEIVTRLKTQKKQLFKQCQFQILWSIQWFTYPVFVKSHLRGCARGGRHIPINTIQYFCEKYYLSSSQKYNNRPSQILRWRDKMMLLQVLLSISPLCLSLPINEDNNEMTTTNSSEPEVLPASAQLLSNLLPPSSIKDCITSNYCHQGNCAQGAILSTIVKNVSSTLQIWTTLVRSFASAILPMLTLRKDSVQSLASLRRPLLRSGPTKSCSSKKMK